MSDKLYSVKGDTLTALADAIRNRSLTQGALSLTEMARRVTAIPTGESSASAALDDDTLAALGALEDAVSDHLVETEGGYEIPRPYIRAYGYQQCLDECTEDNDQPVRMYEWIFQRLWLGDRVSKVTVGGTVYTTTFSGSNDAEYLRIPLTQFEGITKDNYYKGTSSDTLMHIYFRVARDNPELLAVTSWATQSDDSGNLISLAVPLYTHTEQEEMLATCQATAAEVDAKVLELYNVAPGDSLTVDQKIRVSKVIHDWLVLHSDYDTESNGEILDQTMYPALSGGLNSPVCMSYTLAYQWLAARYGIESVAVTGKVEPSTLHAWNMVNFDDTIGQYSSGDDNWTNVDCTWDDPVHVGDDGEYIKEPDYIRWTYLHFPWSMLPQNAGEEDHRIPSNEAYSPYPTDAPEEDLRYYGSEPYTWSSLRNTEMAEEMA